MSDVAAAAPSAAAPAPVELATPAPVEIDSDPVRARVEARREKAERETAERGPDGKFMPKQAKAAEAKPAAKKTTAEAEAKPATEPKSDDGEAKELKAKLETFDARVRELEARNSEWEDVAEKSLAHIEALEAKIEKLKAGSYDERDEELLKLKAGERARSLADERRKDAEKAALEAQEKEQNEAAIGELRNGLAVLVAEHPMLKPSQGMEGDVSTFWRTVYRAHEAYGPAEALRTAQALSKTFSEAAGARAKPAQPLPRTLAKFGGTGGGGQRDLSPEGIREKYMARLGPR